MQKYAKNVAKFDHFRAKLSRKVLSRLPWIFRPLFSNRKVQLSPLLESESHVIRKAAVDSLS